MVLTASPPKTDLSEAENRLISLKGDGVDVAYTYDPDGNRISKTDNIAGTNTKYLVDTQNPTGYAQVVEELDATNAVQVVYTYGLDLISQNRHRIAGLWDKSYYGYDGTGSVRYLMDGTGTVTDTYTYDAFGTMLEKTGTTTNAYLFQGEQFDDTLGLYYLRARYMDPSTGRFATMDLIDGDSESPISLNKYVFGYSDPINEMDPSGFEPQWGARVSELFRNFAGIPMSNSWLEYNGTELIWYQKGLLATQDKYPRYIFRGTSGFFDKDFGDLRYSQYQNGLINGHKDPKGKSYPGPLPTGNYHINLVNNGTAGIVPDPENGGLKLESKEGIQNIPSEFTPFGNGYYDWQASWGKKRARLEPEAGNQMFGRGGFYIHDSSKGFTHGCIETESAIFILLTNYMRQNGSIDVRVNYTGASTFGGQGGLN